MTILEAGAIALVVLTSILLFNLFPHFRLIITSAWHRWTTFGRISSDVDWLCGPSSELLSMAITHNYKHGSLAADSRGKLNAIKRKHAEYVPPLSHLPWPKN